MIFRCALLLLLSSGSAMAEDYACLIEPRQVLKLATPVQGVVASVAVDRGDRVKKGQVVARLDSEVEEANLLIARLRAANDTEIASAQAKLDFLKHKLARKLQLRNNQWGSMEELEEAESDTKVADAQLRENVLNLSQAKLEAQRADGLLRQRQIVSPVDGVVTERTLGPGEFVNDQAHILTIAEMDPLRVETYLPLSFLRPHQGWRHRRGPARSASGRQLPGQGRGRGPSVRRRQRHHRGPPGTAQSGASPARRHPLPRPLRRPVLTIPAPG
jgi:RND family efflux transporter MFP subunit